MSDDVPAVIGLAGPIPAGRGAAPQSSLQAAAPETSP